MTLQEHIDACQALIAENPKAAGYPIIYSKDDEGNEHQQVHFAPTLATATNPKAHYIELEDDENAPKNCVIIN